MRIIFLNCWYAMAGKPFFDFIDKQKDLTDIFCLSEVQPDLYSKLDSILSDFSGSYTSNNKIEILGYIYGQAIFVKTSIKTKQASKVDLFRQVKNDMGFLQFQKLNILEKCTDIGNVHGKARPGHKLDTPARIRQSKKIINFFKDKKGPKIIGGDFNLMPTTKSIKMFEKAGFRNLIREFNIKDTRGELNHKQFKKGDIQYFADYCFVSPDIKLKNFQVPNIEISDHLPLILDFDI